jgi:hypothetical protein
MVSGPRAVALRQGRIGSAYRVFERQLGLDPDADRAPLEAAILDRMLHGMFPSDGLPADACTIATVETGVPVWALDAEQLVGALGICAALPGETLGRAPGAAIIATGHLAVADQGGPLALLFGEPAPGAAPAKRTSLIALFALRVTGVPIIVVDEALWLATSLATER